MIRNVVVEVSHLLRKKEGSGLARRRLLSGLGRLREVHEAVRIGTEAGRWPHLQLPDDAELAAVREIAAELRRRAPRLAVVGQPGAIAALRAITEAFGAESPRWISSPDGAGLDDLDSPEVAWLVLEGPAWADQVAEWAVGRGRVVAMAGAGTHDAPPNGWWISDPVAGDGRFAGLGAAAALCAAWAGVDIEAVHDGARDMVAACQRSALFENPSYTLALTTLFLERDLGVTIPVHVATSGRMEAFTRWLVRMWGAVLADSVPVEGLMRHVGAAGVSGVVGDEELIQVLLLGPRDKHVTLWDVTDGGTGRGSAEASLQSRALQTLLDRENIPYLRVRLPGLDARALGAAMFLAEHSAVTASLFLAVDPLGLAGVSAWYAALDRARSEAEGNASGHASTDAGSDVDAGPPTE
ncbi:MAG: hypothetical protein Q8P18_11875 [Pseudomonadota bacterium]|nr:hypothetical protein [Pseudomonadota bacterium]